MRATSPRDRLGHSMPFGTGGAWADLISSRCGVALRGGQVSLLAVLVEQRMRTLGLRRAGAYFEKLAREAEGGPEWAELMDRLVSHETSFFRHMASFDLLRSHVIPELRRRWSARGTLTFLSAGCSTGPEAYSIAMTALAANGGDGRFTVWGADVSRRAVETARRARYAERTVDAVPEPYRQRFVHRVDARHYEIGADVRERVKFLWANLYAASGTFLSYDVIVCQNVLIYFAPQAVRRFTAMLGARLNPGGYLLFGPGEAPPGCPDGLESINVNGVRAFRRVGRTAAEVRS